jgi:hypothetical protein
VIWGYLRDDVSGKLVNGHVHMPHVPGRVGGHNSWEAMVADSGRYELTVPFGAEITAHAPGYLPQTRQAVIPYHQFGDRQPTRLEFRLRSYDGLFEHTLPACDITGTIVNESRDEQLPATEVWITAHALGTLSDQNGTFVLSAVPAGIQLLHTARVGTAPEVREVLVRCSDDAPLPPITLLVREDPLILDEIIPG